MVATAEGICKRLNTELSRPERTIRTAQDIAHVAPKRAALQQKALDELKKLTPPASKAENYYHILAARLTLVEDTTKLGEDATAKDSKKLSAVYYSSGAILQQLAKTAQAAGFKACGQLG